VPRIDEATLLAMQQHVAQQVAFAQIPDVVKRVGLLSSPQTDHELILYSLSFNFIKLS
jgi:hypothetical protein